MQRFQSAFQHVQKKYFFKEKRVEKRREKKKEKVMVGGSQIARLYRNYPLED